MTQDSRPCQGCGATIYRTVPVAPIQHYCGPDCRPRCSVEGCDKPRHGPTYCSAHHTRWKRYGDAEAPRQRRRNDGACEVEGCDEPMRKRGWCVSHYSQWRRRGTVEPFIRRWAEPGGECVLCGAPVPEGVGRRKYCSDSCQQIASRTKGMRPTEGFCVFCDKPFSLTKRTATGRLQRVDTVWCPDCGRDSPDVQRFKRYGVTRAEYRAATERGCAICRRTDRPLHVDHDHTCCPSDKRCCGECVRGFICGPCNRGLGLFFDNATALRAAADYLDPPP